MASERRVLQTRRFRFRPLFARLAASPQSAVAVAFILIGAVLRLWQYFANSSLWIDEAALARNITDRSFGGLLGSLDYAQVAPPGFLLIEKSIVTLFGTSEFAFRALPLACGLLALPLFWSLAKRILSGWAVPYAVALFALALPLVYFSVQVKQYSSDATAAIVVWLLAMELRARALTVRRALIAGLAGAVLIWFSQPALFVLAAIGAALAMLSWHERDRQAARPLAVMGALWAASAAAVVWIALRNMTAVDGEYFRFVWAEGFMPLPPRSVSDVFWIFGQLTWAFGVFAEGVGRTHGGLNYRWSALFTAVMLFGLWTLWRKRPDAALFLGLPILIVALLSAARLYPFTARLFVFLQPALLLATAAGAGRIASIRRLPQVLVLAVLGILGGAPIYAAVTALPPFWLQHLRPIVERLDGRLEPDDVVYVYYGAGQAFYYYASRYDLPMGQVRMGRCSVGNPRGYLRQLDHLRGRHRVWVVVSHATRRGGEMIVMLAYLDTIGRRLDAMQIPGTTGRTLEAAFLYLYDLSDLERLRTVTAEDFSIPEGVEGLPPGPFGCYGVGLPDGK